MSKRERLKRQKLFAACVEDALSLSERVDRTMRLLSVGLIISVSDFASYGCAGNIHKRRAGYIILELVKRNILHKTYGSTKNALYEVIKVEEDNG